MDKNVIPACKIHVDEVMGICEIEIYDANSPQHLPIGNITKVTFIREYGNVPRLLIECVQKITRTICKKEDTE